jgi:hypothetical protein
MNIVKQSTGNVVLTDAAGNIQKVFVNVNALEVKGTDEVIVKFGFNQWHSLFASQIDNTQVEPAGAVAFTGNVNDLVTLLSSSFFFELSGGGGSLATLSDVSLSSPSYGDYLEYNGTAWVNQGLVYTIELIDALTIDFYAPYDLKINSVTDILNTPTTTIDDDGVAYVLGATIAAGSKITITVDTAAVVNLNITKA